MTASCPKGGEVFRKAVLLTQDVPTLSGNESCPQQINFSPYTLSLGSVSIPTVILKQSWKLVVSQLAIRPLGFTSTSHQSLHSMSLHFANHLSIYPDRIQTRKKERKKRKKERKKEKKERKKEREKERKKERRKEERKKERKKASPSLILSANPCQAKFFMLLESCSRIDDIP